MNSRIDALLALPATERFAKINSFSDSEYFDAVCTSENLRFFILENKSSITNFCWDNVWLEKLPNGRLGIYGEHKTILPRSDKGKLEVLGCHQIENLHIEIDFSPKLMEMIKSTLRFRKVTFHKISLQTSDFLEGLNVKEIEIKHEYLGLKIPLQPVKDPEAVEKFLKKMPRLPDSKMELSLNDTLSTSDIIRLCNNLATRCKESINLF